MVSSPLDVQVDEEPVPNPWSHQDHSEVDTRTSPTASHDRSHSVRSARSSLASVESFGPSCMPITTVPSTASGSATQFPTDVHRRVVLLTKELQALVNQEGPSKSSNVSLCLQTAWTVLHHLSAVVELEVQERGSQCYGAEDSDCERQPMADADFSRSSTANASGLEPRAWMADIGSRRSSFTLAVHQEGKVERTTNDNTCYLHPDSGVRLVWEFSSMIFILILSVLIPLEVCFYWDSDMPLFLVALSAAIDAFFIVDVILNFFTAYHKGHGISGQLVTDFRGIAKHYAKSWLIVDLCASVPWLEVFQLFGGVASSGTEAIGMLKVLKYAKVARMMKVLRVLKLGGLMQIVEEKLMALQSMTVAFQLLKMTIVLLVLSHYFACIWYAVAFFSIEAGQQKSWLQAHGLEHAPGWEQYVAALYFAITTGTSVGYGDITPSTAPEQLVTIVVLVVSVAYIGHFMARASQMVSSLRYLENQTAQAKRDAVLFMKKRAVPKELHFRVLRYIEHVYETDAITSLDKKVMGLLSESLRKQLTLVVTGNVLRNFWLFATSGESFLAAICQVCRTQRAGCGDTIVDEEQWAHDMYWVVRGEAAVLKRMCQVGGLRAGDWFGELGLFLAGAVRKATVRCETNCEFLVLGYDDFHRKVELFPDMRRECEKIAEQLMRGNLQVLKNRCTYSGSLRHQSAQRCPKAPP